MDKYYLYDSDKPAKKYYILFTNPKTGREKRVYFGATGYDDYTTHKDDERKKRYISRHSGMGEKWNDPTTPGFYALHLLWNKTSLGASIKDTNEK
jgi:hypothetical protein